ncbi:MAG: immunoglobulin-like domain-containing protein [Jeotgalicoccus sp.]
MNAETLIKFMIGALPVAPIVSDFVNTDIEETTQSPNQAYENYNGPTMKEETDSHSGNIPAIKGVSNINVQTGSKFDPLAGVYAVDNTDGNITGNIEVTNNSVNVETPGTYSVTYRVENSRNGYYEHVRQITVSDTASDPVPLIPPTEEQLGKTQPDESASSSDAGNSVSFSGVDDLTISTGESFDPKDGVRAIDVDGTDISNQLYISGEVDNETPGEYTIAYAVFDGFGDPFSAARTVTVE